MFQWIGWKQRWPGDRDCWGGGNGMRYWNNALRGGSCGENWHEGDSSGGTYFSGPAPALLGFDGSISKHCRNHGGGGGNGGTDGFSCNGANRNILLVFGNNVHGTGWGYNSCRNLEWQMCAALGKLPWQGSRNIIFAHAPKDMDTRGGRGFDQCHGYQPNGCGDYGYANDDIYFLEVRAHRHASRARRTREACCASAAPCAPGLRRASLSSLRISMPLYPRPRPRPRAPQVCMYSMICRNNEELFRLNANQPFICDVNDDTGVDIQSGFWRLHRLLVHNRNYQRR